MIEGLVCELSSGGFESRCSRISKNIYTVKAKSIR